MSGDREAQTTPEEPAAAAPVTLTLDAEGGDNAPEEIVAGALMAASPALRILLVGRPDVIEPFLAGADRANIEVVPSGAVISSQRRAGGGREEHARLVDRGGRSYGRGGSVAGLRVGRLDRRHAAAALLVVKRAGGIRRPAIVTTLPGWHGPVVFLDAGANADCRPEHLLEFGVLGTAFARTVLGDTRPRVGLLNIGEEDSKGSDLARSAQSRC